jgi:hypothetical protein
MDETAPSSFEVRFLTVGGKPLTVIGPTDAIAELEQRLGDAPDVEVHGLDRPAEEFTPPRDFHEGP